MAAAEQRAHQRLGVVAAQPPGAPATRRARPRRPAGRRGSTATSAGLGVGDDGEPDAASLPPGLADPRGGDVERSSAASGGRRPRRRLADRRPRPRAPRPPSTTAAAATPTPPSASSRRLEERAELEEVEQPLAPRPCRVDRRASSRSTLDRRVAAQHHQLGVVPHPRLVLGQRGPQLRRLLVDVGEDAVEAAVGVDQLGRRLLPHARARRQVVARVAAERGVLRVLRRRDAGAAPRCRPRRRARSR